MQPENSAQSSAGASVVNNSAASAPATPPNENIMAQGVPNGSGGAGDAGIDARGAGANEKSKMSKKQIIGLVVLSLIAVGGVLFGVFGMTSQNNQIAELKGQVSDANNKVAQLEAEKITVEEPSGATTEITDNVNVVVTDTVDTADYIYVGEWGLKIKVPEELKMVSYKFQHYKYVGQDDSTSIVIAGTVENTEELPDYANIRACDGLGAIGRLEKGAKTLNSGLIFSDDNYDYYYNHPQAVCSTNDVEKSQELQTVDLIQTMLTNPDNYSKI